MVAAEMFGVRTGVELERIYIGEQRIEEVIAQSGLLILVEPVSVDQIALGSVEDGDIHFKDARILFFA